jgi:hypothetical protein
MRHLKETAAAIYAALNLVGVTYLVYDTAYRASADIDVAGSDPHNPFLLPFRVTNNSNLFNMYNIFWGCGIVEMIRADAPSQKPTMINSTIISGFAPEIKIGSILNFHCSIESDKISYTKLVLEAKISYENKIFGIMITRNPNPVRFTWITSSAPQWIRGEFGSEPRKPMITIYP